MRKIEAAKKIKYDTMKEILKASLIKNTIISFCIGKVNWDKRIIGYVRSMNKEIIVVDEVDVFGSVVKSRNIKISSISIIETNDSYNKHLEKLKEQGKLIKKTKPLYYYNKGDKFNKKIDLLRISGNICTIFFGTEFITGIIKKLSENILSISSIGYRGTKEGESYFTLESITKIRYQGPLEKKISYLQKK